jgi:hypothetical protein
MREIVNGCTHTDRDRDDSRNLPAKRQPRTMPAPTRTQGSRIGQPTVPLLANLRSHESSPQVVTACVAPPMTRINSQDPVNSCQLRCDGPWNGLAASGRLFVTLVDFCCERAGLR